MKLKKKTKFKIKKKILKNFKDQIEKYTWLRKKISSEKNFRVRDTI